MVKTKEERSEYNKKYREANLEKIKARERKYRKENKKKIYERTKEYKKKYYEENKEKINESKKIYREANLEKIKARERKYRENNLEKKREYDKQNREKNHMKLTIYQWKLRGLIVDDEDEYESIYYLVMSTENCEGCNCQLTDDLTSTGRCMDHDHETGLFRDVLCRACNNKNR